MLASRKSDQPRDLYDAPADRFVADFIGEANIIPCEITSVDGDKATIDIAGFHHSLPARGLPVGAAQLAVRPTRLVLGATEGLPMEVKKATYVGSRMEYTLTAPFATLFARQRGCRHSTGCRSHGNRRAGPHRAGASGSRLDPDQRFAQNAIGTTTALRQNEIIATLRVLP